LGEVHKLGQYPYVNAMTVEGAVPIAEGYTERAKKRVIRLTRRVRGRDEHGDGAARLSGTPGDTIYVLERFF
jgi:polysaccharide export outer membrane protein